MNVNLYSYQSKNIADERPIWQKRDNVVLTKNNKQKSKLKIFLKH